MAEENVQATSVSNEEKQFNFKNFNIYSDDAGQYTNESLLLGIANHLRIQGGGGGGELGEAGESIINMSSIPDKDSRAIARGVYIARKLSSIMGINLMQACGIAGYCMKESGCNPKSVNITEKAGTSNISNSYAKGGNNYGAGIAQWTGAAFKNQNLAVIGVAANTPIESLSMDQQCEMYGRGELGKACLKYDLAKAETLDVAVCIACIQGHGSAHAQNAYREANGNVNSKEYIQAVISRYKPFKTGQIRQDIPRARKWAGQVFDEISKGNTGSPI